MPPWSKGSKLKIPMIPPYSEEEEEMPPKWGRIGIRAMLETERLINSET